MADVTNGEGPLGRQLTRIVNAVPKRQIWDSEAVLGEAGAASGHSVATVLLVSTFIGPSDTANLGEVSKANFQNSKRGVGGRCPLVRNAPQRPSRRRAEQRNEVAASQSIELPLARPLSPTTDIPPLWMRAAMC